MPLVIWEAETGETLVLEEPEACSGTVPKKRREGNNMSAVLLIMPAAITKCGDEPYLFKITWKPPSVIFLMRPAALEVIAQGSSVQIR